MRALTMAALAALATLSSSALLPSEASARRAAVHVAHGPRRVATRPPQPAPGYTWVAPQPLADGTFMPGHWRAPSRAGFVWVEGHFLRDGRYVAGHWRPMRERRGYAWVAGHVGPDGYWVPGHWRRASRGGYRWVEARFLNGLFVAGYWTPVRVRPGHVWVAGHVDHRGRWVSGFWRSANRPGRVWHAGRYERGRFVAGGWQRDPAPRRPAPPAARPPRDSRGPRQVAHVRR